MLEKETFKQSFMENRKRMVLEDNSRWNMNGKELSAMAALVAIDGMEKTGTFDSDFIQRLTGRLLGSASYRSAIRKVIGSIYINLEILR